MKNEPAGEKSQSSGRTAENEVRIRPYHLRDPWEMVEGRGGLGFAGPAVDLTNPKLILSMDDLRGGKSSGNP